MLGAFNLAFPDDSRIFLFRLLEAGGWVEEEEEEDGCKLLLYWP